VIAATTHSDLFVDLAPDVLVQKRFGKEIQIQNFADARIDECSLIKEMRIEQDSIRDWNALSCFHYRGHKASAPRKIFRLMRGSELCGVIVYTYPAPACYGRRLMLPKLTMREINERLSMINRVVVHPKYQTIGLGSKLIRETLPLVGTDVEMIAVMAKYSPFAEKASMRKVLGQKPAEEAKRIGETLACLGFYLKLLSCEKYVQNRIQTLDPKEVDDL
jgi:GNAT superfamily N-acetyltransferase